MRSVLVVSIPDELREACITQARLQKRPVSRTVEQLISESMAAHGVEWEPEYNWNDLAVAEK
jgi:hypothetical protein